VKSKYSFYAVLAVVIFGLGFFQLESLNESTIRASSLTADQLFERMTFAEEDSLEVYSRSKFASWIDADKDCLDTRNEVLKRDSRTTARGKCKITSGTWISWLDGKKFTKPSSLDIDHLVPLAEAWDSGASAWTSSQRRSFANDLGYKWSLQAVTLSVNRSKSDRDIAEWLPRAVTRCAYVQRWMAVKYRWNLSVDSEESDAIERVLNGSCGAQSLALPSRVRGLPDPLLLVQFPDLPPTPTPTTEPVIIDIPITTPDITLAPTTVPVITTPVSTPTVPTTLPTVTPGAFCSTEGAIGISESGVTYTCKTSDTEDRLRWRR
jgi:hypothetical protein